MEQCLTVRQVNGVIKTLLETNALLKKVTVSGEICDCRFQSSGHLYFSLKDDSGRIRCVRFRGTVSPLDFMPENGQDVVVRGSLSLYETTGQYQIVVRKMERAGIGMLYQRFEALKQQLAARGWFDTENKKPIPKDIRRVGIVTSPSGAAVRDMISVIRRRNPSIQIVICPVSVQGKAAAAEIADGIRRLNRLNNVEVIIIGRGGGSMEDLWCFNEEMVAEAVYRSEIPVISAVGHETDFTIADFVADLRAPTPSVAGEFVSADRALRKQTLADFNRALTSAMSVSLNRNRGALDVLKQKMVLFSPVGELRRRRMDLDRYGERMHSAMTISLEKARMRLAFYSQTLQKYNIDEVLNRGFALVRKGDGQAVTSAAQAVSGADWIITFADGDVPVSVREG